jgi:hypothetical protein
LLELHDEGLGHFEHFLKARLPAMLKLAMGIQSKGRAVIIGAGAT